MSRRPSINSLYNKKLLPKIKDLEVERKKVTTRIYLVLGTFAFIYITLFTAAHFADDAKSEFKINIAIFLEGFKYFCFIAAFSIPLLSKNFKNKFKSEVTHKIFELFIQDCEYNPEGEIPQELFEMSNFTEHFDLDHYRGEDHVIGTFKDHHLEFCEVGASQRIDNKNSVTAFLDLFVMIESSEKFKHDVFVKTNTLESYFYKNISGMLTDPFKKSKLRVKLESKQFEKRYKTYCEDQIYARVILTPNIMHKLTKFQKKYKNNIELAFVENKIFLALHTRANILKGNFGRDMFEPRLFSTIINKKEVIETYELLTLLTDIIDEISNGK